MKEFYVGIDLASAEHQVVIRQGGGEKCDEFKIAQAQVGFSKLISEIQERERKWKKSPVIGIEGENGLARPLDQILVSEGWPVYNVNPTKLDRFRDLCGAPYKNDKYDAKLITKLIQMRELIKEAGNSGLQQITEKNRHREDLKLLSRYQQSLIDDLVRNSNRFKQQLRSYFPEIFLLAKDVTCQWVLRILAMGKSLEILKGWKIEQFKRIRGIGNKRAEGLEASLKGVKYFPEGYEIQAHILQQLAQRMMAFRDEIAEIDDKLEAMGKEEVVVQWFVKQVGVGIKTASRIIGEIGNVSRFSNESQLAVYAGVACLDKQSGKTSRGKKGKRINRILKRAMLDWAHSKSMYCLRSKAYYKKKRGEGKKHMHALKCLARQLIKLLFQKLNQFEKEVFFPLAA